MKKILFLFFAVPIIVFGQEEKILNVDDIFFLDGVHRFKSDSTLANGKLEVYLDNKRKFEGFLKDGKYHGVFKQSNPSGQLLVEETWKNGKQEGLGRYWYENGKLKKEITFKDGKIISEKEY